MHHELPVFVGNHFSQGFRFLEQFQRYVGYRFSSGRVDYLPCGGNVARKAFEPENIVLGARRSAGNEHAFLEIVAHHQVVVVGRRVERRTEVDCSFEGSPRYFRGVYVEAAESHASVGSEEEIIAGDVRIHFVAGGVDVVAHVDGIAPAVFADAADIPDVAFSFAARHGRGEKYSVAVGGYERMPYGFALASHFDFDILFPLIVFQCKRLYIGFATDAKGIITFFGVRVVHHHSVVGEVFHLI